MSAFRVAPSAMATGEATGVTAAYAAQKQTPVKEVGHKSVQEQLLATGGILK